ncbi:MAG: hypothetical protein ACP5OO_10635 [Chloroflexia bacterium]
MPFRTFRPGRGYYELLSWKQLGLVGLILLAALLVLGLFLSSRGAGSSPLQPSPPVGGSTAEQQGILDAANCLRQEAGLPPLEADAILMAGAQRLAEALGGSDVDAQRRASVELQNLGGFAVYTSFLPESANSPCPTNRMTIVLNGLAFVLDPEHSSAGVGFAPVQSNLYVLVWLPGGVR